MNKQNTCAWASEETHNVMESPSQAEKCSVVYSVRKWYCRTNLFRQYYEYFVLFLPGMGANFGETFFQ
jgi:hypothetical protein